MYNMYYFSFWYDNSHISCVIEASSEKEAIEMFWKEHPNAENVELDGKDVDKDFGSILKVKTK